MDKASLTNPIELTSMQQFSLCVPFFVPPFLLRVKVLDILWYVTLRVRSDDLCAHQLVALLD